MRATLTTLTPVHIGNGQTLNKNIDFAQDGDKIGFFDLNKIISLIGIDQIDQLTNTIEQNKPILYFLRKERGLKNGMEDFCDRICSVKNISTSTTQLKEQYRTSLKGVCTPGSSLKGAMKTAIWSYQANEVFLNTVKTDDLGVWKKKRGTDKWQWKDEQVDKRMFGKNANEKTTRFLKIGDTHFTDLQTDIYECIILNKYGESWEIKDEKILLEVIPPGSVSTVEIKIDESLFKKNNEIYPQVWGRKGTDFIKANILPLFKIVNSSTRHLIDVMELWDLEKENLGQIGNQLVMNLKTFLSSIDSCQANECIIRVGANSGWNFTTGGWVKAIPEENMSSDDLADLRYEIQKKNYPEDDIWPKTRKVASTGIPFGFVKITLESD